MFIGRVINLDRPQWWVAAALVLLATLTYVPFLSLPPLPDDYLVAEKAEQYGHPSGWGGLFADSLYRCRATSMVVTAAILEMFGFSEIAFNTASLLGHAVNVLLIYLLGTMPWIGWRISAVAALIFAVRERHHEAVVWMSALPEILVLAFVLAAVLAWGQWLRTSRAGWLAATGAAFVLALLSKESGVVLAAILPVLAWIERRDWRLPLIAAVVFGTGSALYFGASLVGSAANQHFHDGSFALQLGFVRVLVASAARNLWFWGSLSLLVFLWTGFREHRRLLLFSVFWLVVGLVPYSFLTYMPRIPSRHHYVASLGTAMLSSVAFWLICHLARQRPMWVAAIPAVFIAHQWGYLWVVKKGQFDDRARPIEMLLNVVRVNPEARIHFRCGEFLNEEARRAIRYRLGPVEPNISTDEVAPAGAIEIPCGGHGPL